MICRYNGKEFPCRTGTAPLAPTAQILGPQLWARFHQWTLTFKGTPAEGEKWLGDFDAAVARMPLCGCAQHWVAIRAARPVDWSNLFSWGVDRHNDVNRKRNVPIFSLADALVRWKPS